MKVKMLKNAAGAVEGIHVREFIEGGVYEVDESLALSFIEEEQAEAHEEPAKEETTAKPGEDVKASGPRKRSRRKGPRRSRNEGS